jgi:hypothetical protein
MVLSIPQFPFSEHFVVSQGLCGVLEAAGCEMTYLSTEAQRGKDRPMGMHLFSTPKSHPSLCHCKTLLREV